MPIEFIKNIATKSKKSPAQVEKMWGEIEKSIKKSNPNLKDEEIYKRVTGAVKSNLGVEDLDEDVWNETKYNTYDEWRKAVTSMYPSAIFLKQGTESLAHNGGISTDRSRQPLVGVWDDNKKSGYVLSKNIEEDIKKREYHSYNEWKKAIRTIYPMSRFARISSNDDGYDDTAYVGKPTNVIGEWNGDTKLGIIFSNVKESIDILDKIESLLK